ncbi:HAMP domain-containing histidine kinase [Psychrosphaera sp. F3M07]|uniref:sensor histidine kinase n=1 Tax=Psychrosphaera sp. F3M07 TaxID=2841560 RepID=UPI001C08F71C|nr:HAMP domain-containing histidine kinase [Psychrosphaera sp. F3M07]
MKQNNFIRFYVFFFIAACAFIISFTQIYKAYFAPPVYHTINVDNIFKSFDNNSLPEYKVIRKQSVQLDDESNQSLNQNDIIAYTVNNNSYYLKKLNDEQLIQWGPIHHSNWEQPQDTLILLIFYSTLAVIFLLLFRPVFRDVNHLQNCAVEFGKKPEAQALTISAKSSVYPLAESLHQMSHQLLKQIQVHKDLSNIIAHEVRTPLARMKFVLQKIAKRIPEKDLRRFKTDIKELETLAHEYLEFGRNQITDANYLAPIQLSEFAEHITNKFVETDVAVVFEPFAEDVIFYANELQIDLALTNLINNGLRFAKSKISVQFDHKDQFVYFIVSDDGPGFSSTQKSSANGEEHQGFGLGLYIVKQVASRHNGEFIIDETDDGGAKMTIKLPNNNKK